MNPETEALIKEQYSQLPEDVKQALKSIPVSQILTNIVQSNGLHIDQAGDLYTETILVILGMEKITDFKNNIQNQLKISSLVAENIVNEINKKVFIGIREFLQDLQKYQVALEKKASEAETEDFPDRNQILSEIENPTPSIHPISLVNKEISGPAKPYEIIAETKETVAHDFIDSKLKNTVNLPSQNAVVELIKPKSLKKEYSADPYREAIN